MPVTLPAPPERVEPFALFYAGTVPEHRWLDQGRRDVPGPLDGVRVFDVTMYMAGPWASQVLGSLGAEVLHVERPDADWSTLNAGAPPMINGTASGYIAWNMNKRGLSVDFKDPDDLQFAYDLIETSDVFMSNMRPLDRMGLGYEKLKEINPRLVYCHATGYGRSGPRGEDRGTDAIMQTFAGVWSAQGSRGGQGEFYRHATQVDATTGNLLAQAAILGLHARKRTGEGQFIEVTMVDAAADDAAAAAGGAPRGDAAPAAGQLGVRHRARSRVHVRGRALDRRVGHAPKPSGAGCATRSGSPSSRSTNASPSTRRASSTATRSRTLLVGRLRRRSRGRTGS